MPRNRASGDFDTDALYAALDRQRTERGLTWTGAAREIWEMSSVLNRQRPGDHPLAASTMRNVARNGDTSCQHALFFVRWLGRTPESFVPGADDAGRPLPGSSDDRRPRWHLRRLYDALDEQRRTEGLTWSALAGDLHCTPNQLTGLRTARYATSMRLAMRICRRLGRPAADFVYAGRW
ncbi:MAG TPA: helix-turn-helix transcriptional regulator [Nocardioides sp.]|uniref:helix-turn-helix domain-containing protein n=1 Tax=Nocardioides sp. TaxID=35761 RepID=UPI002E307FC0|nr:helix-turn-helix transcriptional regulator [Nocardioides sp.]HEX3930284.1 helix-turn-helix transcriptional regulator [Nocardioides sp.]